MTPALPRRVVLAAAPLVAGAAAAQTAPAAPHTVTYVEAAPAAQDQALDRLRQHAAATRGNAALTSLRLLRRIDRPHHLAIVETWKDPAAAEAQRGSPAMAALRASLGPLLIAPYDERPHLTMSVGATTPVPGAIFVVTHIDVVPTGREAGAAATTALTEASRGTPGNLGFDALIQLSRQNHFTVVECWRDEAALLAHAVAAPTIAARSTLGPLGGSLYDERLYREIV